MFSFNNIQQEECEKCSYEGEGEYKRFRYVMVSVSVGLSDFIIMHISRRGEDKRRLKVLLASVTYVP